jgi:hypothetical protein
MNLTHWCGLLKPDFNRIQQGSGFFAHNWVHRSVSGMFWQDLGGKPMRGGSVGTGVENEMG